MDGGLVRNERGSEMEEMTDDVIKGQCKCLRLEESLYHNISFRHLERSGLCDIGFFAAFRSIRKFC